MIEEQAAVGFEPTDNGFANRRLRPLGYAARNQILNTKPEILNKLVPAKAGIQNFNSQMFKTVSVILNFGNLILFRI